jgi:hypothetical protein
MSIEHTTVGAALDTLTVALTQLRALVAAPSADPFYAHAAEQVAAIVAGLEGRANAGLLPDPHTAASATGGLDPVPPNPGVKAGPAPNQQEPPNPGLLPDPPSPGVASATGPLDPVPPDPG